MNFSSFVWIVLNVHLFAVLAFAGQKWQTEPAVGKSLVEYLTEDQQQASSAASQQEYPFGDGERVDKFSSPIGDQFWRSQQQQDLYQEALEKLRQDRLESLAGSIEELNGQYQRLASPGAQIPISGLVGPAAGARNYHALVDKFKHLSPISNPTRESRAFKPKLMSTARGFGKRSYLNGQQQHQAVTYADLLAASNSNSPMASNGKMNGNAIR